MTLAAAVLERLVDIKKGNTLVEGAKVFRRGVHFPPNRDYAMKTSCETCVWKVGGAVA